MRSPDHSREPSEVPVFKEFPRWWEEHRPQGQTSEHAVCLRVVKAQKREKAEDGNREKWDRSSHFLKIGWTGKISGKVTFEQTSS